MDSIRSALGLILLSSIAAAFGGGDVRAAEAQAGAPDRVEKPWQDEGFCRWWMDADDGTHRASISPGDSGLVLTISDPAFLHWSDSEEHAVELLFGSDTGERVKAQAWVTHIADRPASMFSAELDGAAVARLGGATRIVVTRDGKWALAMDLARTPSRSALEACIPPPGRGQGDAES